jgi:spore maturation protein CgeB
MRIVILGLSITSSWGNGHATTYRGLVRELAARGHDITFFERDVPWYAQHRDAPRPPGATTQLYDSLTMLVERHAQVVREADCVIVGSYVPDGIRVSEWVIATATGVTAFYDIDTPVTLAGLERGSTGYLSADLIPRYDLYLSFSGGPTLQRLEREFGAPMARALYCSVDTGTYRPVDRPVLRWDLGYLGTYSDDRQPGVDALILDPARRLPGQRFVVAGPQYPASMAWPANVERIEHLPPAGHPAFYTAQRFTLNVTRADMVRAGWSPSVRLFEAAACGVPIVSDWWEGLDEFFEPGHDILIARAPDDVERWLCGVDEAERAAVGQRGRARILAAHTAAHRAAELERFITEAGIARVQRQRRRRASAG